MLYSLPLILFIFPVFNKTCPEELKSLVELFNIKLHFHLSFYFIIGLTLQNFAFLSTNIPIFLSFFTMLQKHKDFYKLHNHPTVTKRLRAGRASKIRNLSRFSAKTKKTLMKNSPAQAPTQNSLSRKAVLRAEPKIENNSSHF